MDRLQQQFSTDKLVVLPVNEGEDVDTIESFIAQLDRFTSLPVLQDLDGRAMAFWTVRGLPTTYIVDKHGRIAYRAIGGREFDHPDIVRALNNLVNEK